ncbi:phosphatidylinositol-3-phosphate-binding protein BEM1 [Paracoccidioides brasiliensis Pb18]|uniref:Bud emergence protein 1 n=2 Tax=Paracoccidioides brasiliensis TaxID=121759 RepID=C1GMY3_PARBD|nr:phosphatidylinositol-3-phosphate-binding protein BEM1 [Paracoccidioides brasiliensis Pb18]EEH44985.2 hypothetical protein PADG_08634 [Paracoccidioides brasiliensis Pb18]ODH18830.1 hypothetical protein ACO22_06204 [Paracoccidioides brasiliensis]ODH46408.1 hypothetical protein GX48_07505 [Paracoccidioides brasiliensis]
MKAIRRSLKGEKEPKPQHISITPKSAIAILPPKKVIKALFDHTPEPGNTQELAFTKGDFFHVISREDDTDWYEACNPLIPSARGLVPVSFFEVIGKNERNSGGSAGNIEDYMQEPHDSGFSDRSSQQATAYGHGRSDSTNTTKQAARARMSSLGKGSGAMVYGIVQYDFNAERPDELDAKAGEAIIVIAQSNPEWFVAKPIGRLGGPGLIPVSFIEIRDMTTGMAVSDPHEAVRRAGVPRVEEWKKMTAEYKNSSISLGKLESGAQGAAAEMGRMTLNGSDPYQQQQCHNSGAHSQNHQYQNQQLRQSAQQIPQRQQQQQQQQGYYPPALAPVSATIPRYCFDQDKYWFIIEAKMEDGRYWELSRYYHDFYDFQIALLREFEEEAGNKGKPRTLPFMPGPVTHVTDAITNGRRQNLDEYIKKLLLMPPHISRCQLVRQLFAPRPGDFEIDPNVKVDDYRLSHGSQQSSIQDPSRPESGHSSRGQLHAGGYPPGGMGPPHSQRQAQSTWQPALLNGGNGSTLGNSGSTITRADMQNQMMNRQASSLTQGSATSSGGAIKIKVFFQDDLIAIRVPNDISFQQLKEKLKDRLKVDDEIVLQYKDEPSNGFVGLSNDNDLDTALQRNAKLTLYVGLT